MSFVSAAEASVGTTLPKLVESGDPDANNLFPETVKKEEVMPQMPRTALGLWMLVPLQLCSPVVLLTLPWPEGLGPAAACVRPQSASLGAVGPGWGVADLTALLLWTLFSSHALVPAGLSPRLP